MTLVASVRGGSRRYRVATAPRRIRHGLRPPRHPACSRGAGTAQGARAEGVLGPAHEPAPRPGPPRAPLGRPARGDSPGSPGAPRASRGGEAGGGRAGGQHLRVRPRDRATPPQLPPPLPSPERMRLSAPHLL